MLWVTRRDVRGLYFKDEKKIVEKKINYESVLDHIKKEPKIAKSRGLDVENLDLEKLKSLDFNFLMDILFEYSNPIRNLNE